MFEIESGIPFLEEESKQHYVEPAKTIVQDDEFYGATSEQKRAYLAQRQSLPLSVKIRLTERRISEWYEAHNGKVYVAFSGGKDSTVLLDIVRSLYPEVPAVFSDTGLEYPEIRDFVKTIDNVVWLKPKKNFKQVIEKYGYPIISKEVSMAIQRYRDTKFEVQKQLRLHGGLNPNTGRIQTTGIIPKKYQYLINAPFKISEKCCDFLKKQPIKTFEKESGLKPFIGVMAEDSKSREFSYIRSGCNAFDATSQQSRPMMFWKESDVWEYIKTKNISYCCIYDKGMPRTGCMFCMFGVKAQSFNRFLFLEKHHPDLHKYCMDNLGLKDVLSFIGEQGSM